MPHCVQFFHCADYEIVTPHRVDEKLQTVFDNLHPRLGNDEEDDDYDDDDDDDDYDETARFVRRRRYRRQATTTGVDDVSAGVFYRIETAREDFHIEVEPCGDSLLRDNFAVYRRGGVSPREDGDVEDGRRQKATTASESSKVRRRGDDVAAAAVDRRCFYRGRLVNRSSSAVAISVCNNEMVSGDYHVRLSVYKKRPGYSNGRKYTAFLFDF